jgi:dipeptidase D
VVQLSGARGGHSGGDIASGRANAIKALGRVLATAFDVVPFRLATFEGGVSRNAIPRAAEALVAVPGDGEPSFRRAAEGAFAAVRRRHAQAEDALVLSIEPAHADGAAATDTTRAALDLVTAVPTGVVAMSPELANLVETSTSLTVARTEDGVLELSSMTRSSSAPALDDVVRTLEALARFSGARVEVRRSYPPWEPRLDGRLLETAKRTFARLVGSEPALTVVHGGLECAVLGGRLPGVEMIAIGPEIVGPHAPGERVRISSTQRFYELLGALLDDLSR